MSKVSFLGCRLAVDFSSDCSTHPEIQMIRKLALGSVFCLWLLSILVPPWQRDRPIWQGRQMVSELAGYGWIFEGPFNTGPGFPRIDYRRLALEWLFLGSLGGAIVYFQRRKP